MNHNDVKPFCEVIKIETKFLTSKCVEKGYPIFFFFRSPDLIDLVNVKSARGVQGQ